MTPRNTPGAGGHPRGPLVGGRGALRLVTVTAVTALSVLVASPAFASKADDGDDPGTGLSTGATLLIFVGVPIAAFLVISLLVAAPSLARGPRYRPGLGWWAAPVWYGGPGGDADAAVRAAEPAAEGGGTSARW